VDQELLGVRPNVLHISGLDVGLHSLPVLTKQLQGLQEKEVLFVRPLAEVELLGLVLAWLFRIYFLEQAVDQLLGVGLASLCSL